MYSQDLIHMTLESAHKAQLVVFTLEVIPVKSNSPISDQGGYRCQSHADGIVIVVTSLVVVIFHMVCCFDCNKHFSRIET